MKKPIFTNLTKEQSDYIDYLENYNTSNIGRLIKSIDDTAGIIADDMNLMANSTDDSIESSLKLLGNKKSQIFNQYLSLVASVKNFKNIIDFKTVQTTPDKDEPKSKKEQPIISKNMFEEISDKVKHKNGNS